MKIESQKLKCIKYDEEKYSVFIKDQIRKLIEMGFDRKTAESQAREIASCTGTTLEFGNKLIVTNTHPLILF